MKSRCRPATSGWSSVRWPRKCGWVPSIPVSTTAQTIRSPWALKDRRAASALTVTHDASTCRCTGKSGQIRWMLRSGHTTGAASAATSRSTSCIDSSPVAYWSATRRGPGPPVTRRHRSVQPGERGVRPAVEAEVDLGHHRDRPRPSGRRSRRVPGPRQCAAVRRSPRRRAAAPRRVPRPTHRPAPRPRALRRRLGARQRSAPARRSGGPAVPPAAPAAPRGRRRASAGPPR